MEDPKPLLASDATPWEARLLRAARDEEPSAEARALLQRKLGLPGVAMPAADAQTRIARGLGTGARKLGAKWLVLAGTGAALLGALPLLLQASSGGKAVPQAAHEGQAQRHQDTPQAAPLSALEQNAPSAADPLRTHENARVEPAAPLPAASHGASAPLADARSLSPSLAAELASLEHARAELRQGDPARALSQLAAYERRYPRGALREEAFALRWEALLARGDAAEADRTARAFLRRYPGSVHAVRIRAQLAQTDDAR